MGGSKQLDLPARDFLSPIEIALEVQRPKLFSNYASLWALLRLTLRDALGQNLTTLPLKLQTLHRYIPLLAPVVPSDPGPRPHLKTPYFLTRPVTRFLCIFFSVPALLLELLQSKFIDAPTGARNDLPGHSRRAGEG